MSLLLDIFGRTPPVRYGTGMWPFVYPRPWNMNPPPGIGALIDPVAVASELARELRVIGWPGISLMDQDFQMSLIDKSPEELEQRLEAWFSEHRAEVADELQARLSNYGSLEAFKTAKTAAQEALSAYREARDLVTVRVLVPEFESVARTLLANPTQQTSQTRVIKDLQETLRSTPLIKEEPLETMSVFNFVEQLFENCYTEADAAALGNAPNRHAELHGLASYGNLRGASIVICTFDLTLRTLQRQIDLGTLILPA